MTMAWWDHEDLKSHKDKSDRYKVEFPDEFTAEEVKEAAERIANKGKHDVQK